MRILVTDGMDKSAQEKLREMGHEVVEQFYEPDELGKALQDFDAVVVRSKTKVRANHIDEALQGKLKLIIRGGAPRRRASKCATPRRPPLSPWQSWHWDTCSPAPATSASPDTP